MEGLTQRISRAMLGQEQATITILSTLLAVQDELGYLPKEGIESVARFTESTINDVWAVASFYPNFRFEPPCLHQVEVCWGASCHLVGAMPLMEAVMDACGLETEGDREDGRALVAVQHLFGGLRPCPGHGDRPPPHRPPDPRFGAGQDRGTAPVALWRGRPG